MRAGVKKTQDVGSDLDFEKPYQNLKPDTFFRFTREYPQQEAVATYVYRVLPKINRRQVGIATNYIGIHTDPLDEQTLLRQYGSGLYMMKFTDSNQPKGLTNRAQTKVDLSDPDFPPVVDPRELVMDDEKSRPYIDDMRARGALKPEPSAAASETPAVGALADVTKKLLDERAAGASFDKQMMPLLLKMMDQKPNVIDEAVKLAGMMRPQESPVTAELLKLVLQQRQQPQQDPFEAYERFEKVAEKIAARNSSSGSGWAEFARSLPAVIQTGFGLYQAFTAMLPQPQQTQPTAPGPTAPASTAVVPQEEPMQVRMMRLLQQTGERAFKAFERGVSGDHFAAALTIDEDGEQAYAVLSEMGRDGIMEALSQIPGAAGRIGDRREKLVAWLDDFLSYGAAEDAADEGGQV